MYQQPVTATKTLCAYLSTGCARGGDLEAEVQSAGATAYVVKRSDRSGGRYEKLTTVPGTSYVDRTVTNGRLYHYIVAAVDEAGEGTPSPEEAVTPAGSPLLSPAVSPDSPKAKRQ